MSFENSSTASIVVTLTLAVLLLAACSTNRNTMPSVDAGPQPLVELSLTAPSYLKTGIAPSATIDVDFLRWDSSRISQDAARQLVEKSAVIESYPAQTAVAGKWSSYTTGMTFTPAADLAAGDHVLRFPNAGTDFVVKPRPYNVFRVGSGPLRLAEIELLRDKSGGGTSPALVRVVLRFSEPPATGSTLPIEVKQLVGSNWTALTVTQQTTGEAKLTQAIDPDQKLRVTVGGIVDGSWTGIAGSGPVVAEFVPRDHQIEPGQVQYYVPPNLSISLPSGAKKP